MYYLKTIIKNSDIKTFRVLNNGYAADKNSLYYDGQTVKGSDPDTFEVLDDNFVRDQNHIYMWGNIADDDYEITNKK